MSTIAPTGSPTFRNNYSMIITPTVVREVSEAGGAGAGWEVGMGHRQN